MRFRNSSESFGVVAQSLHWITAGLIVLQYVLARMAAEASLFQQLVILARHKSVGITILALTALRLGWRLTNPPVAPPPGQPRYEQILARLTHALMYALIIALPLTGWLLSSVANVPVSYFGTFALPALAAPDESWVEPLEELHATLFNILASLVIVHAGAAAYHHVVRRDNVLRRMVPGWNGGRS